MNNEIELKPCPLEPCPPESGALDFIEWHSKYLRLQAENVRLREALEFYSNPRDYVAPFTGGLGKLYYDCGAKAQAALQHNEEV